MKIKFNEINNLFNELGVDNNRQEEFICDLEETDEYGLVIEERIMDSVKHLVYQYVRDAISCGFDTEIMVRDYDVPEEIAEIINGIRFEDLEIKF